MARMNSAKRQLPDQVVRIDTRSKPSVPQPVHAIFRLEGSNGKLLGTENGQIRRVDPVNAALQSAFVIAGQVAEGKLTRDDAQDVKQVIVKPSGQSKLSVSWDQMASAVRGTQRDIKERLGKLKPTDNEFIKGSTALELFSPQK